MLYLVKRICCLYVVCTAALQYDVVVYKLFHLNYHFFIAFLPNLRNLALECQAVKGFSTEKWTQTIWSK